MNGAIYNPTMEEVKNASMPKRRFVPPSQQTPEDTPLLDTQGIDQTADVQDILNASSPDDLLDAAHKLQAIKAGADEAEKHLHQKIGEHAVNVAAEMKADQASQLPMVQPEPAPADATATTQTPPQKEEGGIGNALGRLFGGENYSNFTLPLLGIIESIATRGRSPGTAALTQQKIAQEREVYETEKKTADEEARQKAIERQQKKSYQDEIGTVNWTKPDASKQAIAVALKHGDVESAAKFANMKNQEQWTPDEIEILKQQFGSDPKMLAMALMGDPARVKAAMGIAFAKNEGMANQPMTPEQQLKADQEKKDREQWEKLHPGVPFKTQIPKAPKVPGAAPAVSKEELAHVTKLREEYVKASTEYGAVKASYDMLKSASQGEQTPGKDAQFLSAYRRMMNPQAKRLGGNIGEDETYAGGVLNRVQHAIAKTATGQLIDHNIKKQMEQDADQLWQTHVKNQMAVKKSYETLGKSYGVSDPSGITATVPVPQDVPAYNSEAEARAAGHGAGEVVKINGVGKVRLK
jgi:hypothetical protein